MSIAKPPLKKTKLSVHIFLTMGITGLNNRPMSKKQAPAAPSPMTRLDEFVHSFSHYHLHVTPLVVAGARLPRVADDAGRGWYSRDEWQALGLPAPVRRLLQTVFEDERWRETCTA
jgi:adenine-specific DNA glycosylase